MQSAKPLVHAAWKELWFAQERPSHFDTSYCALVHDAFFCKKWGPFLWPLGSLEGVFEDDSEGQEREKSSTVTLHNFPFWTQFLRLCVGSFTFKTKKMQPCHDSLDRQHFNVGALHCYSTRYNLLTDQAGSRDRFESRQLWHCGSLVWSQVRNLAYLWQVMLLGRMAVSCGHKYDNRLRSHFSTRAVFTELCGKDCRNLKPSENLQPRVAKKIKDCSLRHLEAT